MLQKALKQYSTDSKPQLAVHFVNASKEVYGCAPYIHNKLFPKFRVFEDDLRDQNISPHQYAYTVLKVMRGFVQYKHWQHLPINMFLGNYCLKKYLEIQATDTVRIDVKDTNYVLFHDELVVARMYVERNIHGTHTKLSEVVKDLEPLLSKTWLQVYSLKEARPIAEVVEHLVVEYAISQPVRNYRDIVAVLS